MSNNIQEALLSSIEIMIKNTVTDYIPQEDFECTVLATKNDKYKVSINGATYYVTNGVGIKAPVGTGVWVRVPNGNYAKAFIISARGNAESNGGGGGGGADYDVATASDIIELFNVSTQSDAEGEEETNE